MLLSAAIIGNYVRDGKISILPRFDEAQLRPAGLRVHLDETVLVPAPGQEVDLGQAGTDGIVGPIFEKVHIGTTDLVLPPGGFALGSTVEHIRLDRALMCRLDGRSTLARLGLLVHCTAQVVDGLYGSHAAVVLELANVGPFRLRLPYLCGIGILQFERISGRVAQATEQSQYLNQSTTLPPDLSFPTASFSLEAAQKHGEAPEARVRLKRTRVKRGPGRQHPEEPL